MNTINLYDIILELTKKKKIIIIFTLICSIIAVVYSLLVPEYWVSRTSFLPVDDNSSSFNFGANSLLGLGANLVGGVFQVQGTEMLAVMNSREFVEDVIMNFDIINYLELDDEDPLVLFDKAYIKMTESIVKEYISDESGLINVKVETKDKELSANIANYYVEKLNDYYLNIKMTKGKQKREFLEKRVSEINAKLDSLSLELVKYQEENRILEPTQQMVSVIEIYSNILVEKINNDIQLELLRNETGENNPKLITLKLRNDILNNKIKEIEGLKEQSISEYLVPLKTIPVKSAKYADIMMKIEIQKIVYEYLYPQYEQAKLEEIKDLPSIQVIDKARIAGIRSKPKRAKLCIVVFLSSFIFISSLIIFTHLITETDKAKLRQSWSNIFKR